MQPWLIHKNLDFLNKHVECKLHEGSNPLNFLSSLLYLLSLA